MDNKFYWLKLKRDFFKRHDIKIIEAMPNGKDYILFYLKLLCESVDHEGNLRFSSEIPYDENMLSIITNTNIDVVRSAIKVFSQLGMMELLDDGTYYMNEVNKMIGSAVDNDNANRQRRFREKQKELALQERYESVTKNNESKSIEIDIEKDIDIDIENINTLAQNRYDVSNKFNTFWSAYPKKVGKEKCLNWFKIHKPNDELLQKMLTTIEAYKKTKQWSVAQYIPHPYTWLNQGRWDDEIEQQEEFSSYSKTPIEWEEIKPSTLEEDIEFFKEHINCLPKMLDGMKNYNPEREKALREVFKKELEELGE